MHCSPTLARPGGCWARSDSVVALESRRGRGRGRRRSRPTVWPPTAARVWAWASPGLWLLPCQRLGGCQMRPQPGRRPGSLALATGLGVALLARRLRALARPVCQPTLGLLAGGLPGL